MNIIKIAIYSRKSKATDQGESIDNQINACKDYILRWSNLNASDVAFIIYQDEGFTGGNLDRPQFQKLLNDARKDKFNMLICYRLDRVSRNIADFANTYELLQAHNVEFISVKEQFDTSTPIGRAMLNIAMVFAQLERETIAERVRDNMHALARTGRWLGGITPTGFNSEPIEYFDSHMRAKKMYQLVPDRDELDKIKIIFNKFLEVKSLRGTESYLLIHDIYSKNNCKYTADTIKDILKNLVYVAADQAMYEYLSHRGCQICNDLNEFDGQKALIGYNKTDQSNKKVSKKKMSEWIVAIGNHRPILSGTQWIMIQELLSSNTAKSFYTTENTQYGLLNGLIKCAHCGASMNAKKGKVNRNGVLAYTYVCYTKEISRRTKCHVKNIIGQDADKDVLTYLLQLTQDGTFTETTLSSNQIVRTKNIEQTSRQLENLTFALRETEQSINNLMKQLSKLPPESELVKRYMDQLSLLDRENTDLRKQIDRLSPDSLTQKTISLNLNLVHKALYKLNYLKHTDDIKLQRALMRTVIESITWDGENLKISLFGQDKRIPAHLCSHSKCYSNG